MKILFIAPLPPPVHGSAMVSQYIKDSRVVNEAFDCDFVNLSTSRSMEEIGKGGIKKLFRFVASYLIVLWKLITHRYSLCYLAITCHGMASSRMRPSCCYANYSAARWCCTRITRDSHATWRDGPTDG